ncbi:MAG TPA: ABC transporter permease [Acidimicrobiales bacterium]|nr:ABC transporter permease [Acidimicrobiales bacterium]
MRANFGRRALRLLLVLLLVSFATFAMVRLLPGDPARAFLGPSAPESAVLAIRRQLGLNQALPVAYIHWLGRVLYGNLGTSYQTGQAVTQALAQRLPISAELVIGAELVALTLAIPLSLVSAYRADGLVDRSVSGISFATIAVPGFVLALVLIFIFPVRFGLLQVSGFTYLSQSIPGNIQSVTLPVLTLALPLAAVYTRVLRADLVEVLREDYIAMARARGVPTWRILLIHAFKPASLSLLTLAGLNIGQLLSGAVIVEQIFALPGIGSLLIGAILAKDIFVLQGVVLVITVTFVVANLLVDLLYSLIDPRIRRVLTA